VFRVQVKPVPAVGHGMLTFLAHGSIGKVLDTVHLDGRMLAVNGRKWELSQVLEEKDRQIRDWA